MNIFSQCSWIDNDNVIKNKSHNKYDFNSLSKYKNMTATYHFNYVQTPSIEFFQIKLSFRNSKKLKKIII